MSRPEFSRPRQAGVLGAVLVVLLTLVVLPGCGPVDRGGDLVSRAITSIDAAPGNWQAVGRDLVDQLGKEGSALLTQVQTMYTNVLGQTQNFTFCAVDFFGTRFNDGLKAVLHGLDPTTPEPALTPVVCNTNPPTQVEAGSTRVVTLYGFDFATYAEQTPFSVQVEYKDRSVPMESVGSLSTTSNYQLGIDLQAVDFSALEAERGPKLVIKWGPNDVVRASGARTELPILLPLPPAVRYATFDVRVEKHADSGVFSGYCTELETSIPVVQDGLVIDANNGDPQHPGISEIGVQDNQQSIRSLRGYNYRPTSPTAVLVSGRICGDSGKGPGAIFSRSYRIFLRSN